MTPDGISTEDWDEVHDIAVQIANLSSVGDDAGGNLAQVRMLSLLDRLDAKYGPRPSLLSLRADYVDSPLVKEDLLLRAYASAEELNEPNSKVWGASELAAYYIEEAGDLRKGADWLFILRELLAKTPSKAEQAVVNRLELLLLKLD